MYNLSSEHAANSVLLFYYSCQTAQGSMIYWDTSLLMCSSCEWTKSLQGFCICLYYITAAWRFPGRLSFLFQTEMPPLLGFKHHYLFYPKHFNLACLFVILSVNWEGREGCMVEVGVFGILPNVICMYSEKIMMLSPRNVPLTIRPR